MGGNAGLGPLRRNAPFSAAGMSPVTFRSGDVDLVVDRREVPGQESDRPASRRRGPVRRASAMSERLTPFSRRGQ